MKQFSLILNILLVAAVGVLFYLHFSIAKKQSAQTGRNNPSASSTGKDSCAKGSLIAYVEIEAIYDSVNYIKLKQKDIESKQSAISNTLQSEAMKLETEKNEFLKRGNSITQAEYEAFEKEYFNKQRNLEEKKQNELQGLATARNQAMESIQKDMRIFLNDYNTNKGYSYIFATGTSLEYMLYKDSTHNITPEVIKGLNEYFSKKGK